MQAVLLHVYTLTGQKTLYDSGSHCRLQGEDMVLTLSFQKRVDGKFEECSRSTEEENVQLFIPLSYSWFADSFPNPSFQRITHSSTFFISPP